jgi:hypothetical protein
MKWFAVLALLLCGCPVPEPEEDGGTRADGGACPTELVLGTEAVDGGFSPLPDGAPLKIHSGPQGGWHVFVSVNALTLPRTGTVSYVLRSGSSVVSAPLQLELVNLVIEPIECGWERRSDALTFNTVAEPYRGATGELEVRLETFGASPVVVKRAVALF